VPFFGTSLGYFIVASKKVASQALETLYNVHIVVGNIPPHYGHIDWNHRNLIIADVLEQTERGLN
jgi:hypothetical protein